MMFRNMEAPGVTDARRVAKVGDTVSDIREGKNAGCISIGVIEGSSEMAMAQDEFEALGTDEQAVARERVGSVFRVAGADAVIDTFAELPALLRQLQRFDRTAHRAPRARSRHASPLERGLHPDRDFTAPRGPFSEAFLYRNRSAWQLKRFRRGLFSLYISNLRSYRVCDRQNPPCPPAFLRQMFTNLAKPPLKNCPTRHRKR